MNFEPQAKSEPLEGTDGAEEGNGSTEWWKVRALESDSLFLALPFATCVTFGRLLNLSVRRFL